MKTTIIGDVHGHIEDYKQLTSKFERSIQVGDMGVGFRGVKLPTLSNHYWFRGNHDNPSVSRKHPQYLGDYGVFENIFFCAGAKSVDAEYRTPLVSWWPDEQLNESDLSKAIELYRETKPDVMLSHDCPWFITDEICKAVVKRTPSLSSFGPPRPYPTPLAFDEMLKIHRPKMWIFGHWHISWQLEVEGTIFRCIDELEAVTIDH